MSLHTMSGWQNCGDGFSGADKLTCLVSNVRGHTRNKEMDNPGSKIVTDTTPAGKGKDKRGKKQRTFSDVALNKNRSSGLWRRGDFLEEFSINEETASQESDDISWSSSSSDECLPSESHLENPKRASQVFSLRKRKHPSPNTSSNAVLHSKSAPSRPQLLGTGDPSPNISSNAVLHSKSAPSRPQLLGTGDPSPNTSSNAVLHSKSVPSRPQLLGMADPSPNTSSNAILHSKSVPSRPQLLGMGDPSQNCFSAASENCFSSQYLIPPHMKCQANLGHSDAVSESGNSTLMKYMPKLTTPVQSELSQKMDRKQNEISWTLPSFDVGSLPAAATSKEALRLAGKFKLKGTMDSVLPHKGRCLKSRVVRRLSMGESPEPFGHISDVESDVDDELNIQTSHDGGDSDDEALPGVNPCSRDEELGQDVALHEDIKEGVKDSQINISSGTTSSGSSAQSEKMRASDWIKALQKQKTPLKAGQEKSSQEDSSKKKRKFARGSLADQLTRLINREKASVRFWYHSVKGGTFDEKCSKYLLLKLLSLDQQFSVVMSRCHLMEESAGGVPCKVVFLRETVEKLCLKPGMVVQVFAPWHQLEENDGMRTILCTHFVRVSSGLNPEPSAGEVNKNDGSRLTASASWACPCSKDSHMASRACPAATCPVITHLSQTMSCPGASVIPSAKLQTVTASAHHPSATAVSRLTLLESLEAMRGHGSLLPPFSASVLRVFRHRLKGALKQGLQLLVEDPAGTLAIVQLSDGFDDVPKPMCQVGGKMVTFSCLHVASRTNRDKDPALFGIVDQVWRQQFLRVGSQQSGSEASQLQLRTAAPSFAYVLHTASAGTCTSAEEQNDTAKEVLDLMTLKQVEQNEPETRVSFIARVLLPPRFSQVSGSTIVYVYDSTIDTEGSTRVQRVEIGRECVMEESATAVYLFRDVLLKEGSWQCDGYTLVLDMPAWTMWDVHDRLDSSIVASVLASSAKLAHVCGLSEPGLFVSLEGIICEIDENLSYSWEECEACGSDRLATSEESGAIYCTSCNRQVMSPVFRVRMEVFVTCRGSLSHLVVKIDLTQKTIESLLPAEPSEEGHDTQLVIGKVLKCPACLVDSRVPAQATNTSRVPAQSTETSRVPKTFLKLTELQC